MANLVASLAGVAVLLFGVSWGLIGVDHRAPGGREDLVANVIRAAMLLIFVPMGERWGS